MVLFLFCSTKLSHFAIIGLLLYFSYNYCYSSARQTFLHSFDNFYSYFTMSIIHADQSSQLDHRFCVAPMIDWTDRHCRYFHRLLSKSARLYTEMVTTGAILHGDAERYLETSSNQQPVALQLGGSDPQALAESIQLANAFAYDEYNLNVGCPSDRVQSGRFGACLMAEPKLVADCFQAMQENSHQRLISIKCRTGIDHNDSFEFLLHFIETLYASGCRVFIVHARKAWLSGLSPKQNREIPPLDYTRVHRLCEYFPDAQFIVNGGIVDLQQAGEQLSACHGVMIGRAAYQNPWLLQQVDHQLFQQHKPSISRHDVIHAMLPYIEQELQRGTRLHHITRHMLGLFNGMKGAKQYRRFLSENANQPGANAQTLLAASHFVDHESGLMPQS